MMKKYIAPSMALINVATEDDLLAGSPFSAHEEVSNGTQKSNARSASSTIWGFDDEAK